MGRIAMSDGIDSRMVRCLSVFAAATSLISAGVGLSTLWGWWFHLQVLKSWLPGQPSVRVNASVCFLLLGIALDGIYFSLWPEAPKLF